MEASNKQSLINLIQESKDEENIEDEDDDH